MCLIPTAAAHSIHASPGCAVVLALPEVTVPGSAWMVNLTHSSLAGVLLIQFGEEGESGQEAALAILWVRKSCALGK